MQQQSQYRPSTNPYWAKIQSLNEGVFTDENTEQFRGRWKEKFAPHPNSPLHVEIGCNGGHVLLKWAEQNPSTLFVGIDWKFKQIYLAYEKAKKRGLKNVIFLRAHATRLPLIFGPAEIDALFLFFPDPWPKRAHHPNRFVSTDTLRILHPVLAKNGLFHIKTDHDEYFEWMLDKIKPVASDWKVESETRNLHETHPDPTSLMIPDVTLFERIFIREGIRIKSLKLRKA